MMQRERTITHFLRDGHASHIRTRMRTHAHTHTHTITQSHIVFIAGPSGTRSWSHVVNSARRRSPESVPAMLMQVGPAGSVQPLLQT
jgi:hypothetical protein